MKQEIKQCNNCKQDFTIEPDDFGFYEKIKVPAPTFCPECRYIRRLLDRNEYNFYKNINNKLQRQMIIITHSQELIYLAD